MIDLVIAFLAAEGIPAAIVLLRMRRMGAAGDAGAAAALMSLGRGSLLTGLELLLLLQALLIPAALAAVQLALCWRYRKLRYLPAAAAAEAAVEIRCMHLTAMTKRNMIERIVRMLERREEARGG